VSCILHFAIFAQWFGTRLAVCYLRPCIM
jgi:hypothetical protein